MAHHVTHDERDPVPGERDGVEPVPARGILGVGEQVAAGDAHRRQHGPAGLQQPPRQGGDDFPRSFVAPHRLGDLAPGTSLFEHALGRVEPEETQAGDGAARPVARPS
ncbi:hypothetical protein [Amycolatopsis sp. FDAARGOS 1241]|uniref:hypothetical protein n=1 Tax=Amycolatopsis sp. FDAARGOS 1241 TaxID=2778070 RepID=UPI001EF2665E|nr:hypothetical protein [Amycolatopsis sp. FDAARGOS 1241]